MGIFRWLLLVVCILPEGTGAMDDQSTTFIRLVTSALDNQDNNRSFFENAAMIQHSFCRYQKPCKTSAHVSTNGTIATPFPDPIPIELESIYTKFHGCCYSCSCSDDCLQLGNCCLDKLVDIEGEHEEIDDALNDIADMVRAECVVAHVLSYTEDAERYKDTMDVLSYYMIKQCYLYAGNGEPAVEYKCTRPNPEVIDEAVPVTSSTTNVTYHNRYCALCNGETHVVPWKIRYSIKYRVRLCGGLNTSHGDQCAVERNVTMQFAKLSKHASLTPNEVRITFDPPDSFVNVHGSVCLQKSLLNNVNKCEIGDNLVPAYSEEFLNKACDVIQMPFQATARTTFPNVFCAICTYGHRERVHFGVSDKRGCERMTYRTRDKSYTGLLNYQADEDSTETTGRGRAVGDTESPCGCLGIMDTHKKSCRPLYCALGDERRGCMCTPIRVGDTHRKFSIHLKLTPEDDRKPGSAMENDTEAVFDRLDAFFIGKVSEKISILTMYLLTKRNESSAIYHLIVIVETEPGKEASDIMCEVGYALRNQHTITVGTSNMTVSMTSSFGNKQLDDINMTVVGNSNGLYSIEWLVFINNFTKLSCCKYVVLDPEEVHVNGTDGDVVLKATGNLIPDEYWHQENGGYIAICADDYAATRGHVSGTSSPDALLGNVVFILLSLTIIMLI